MQHRQALTVIPVVLLLLAAVLNGFSGVPKAVFVALVAPALLLLATDIVLLTRAQRREGNEDN